MCVVCRGRFEQSTLFRLQCKDGEIVRYIDSGRSFYLCRECIDKKDEKRLLKRLNAVCKKEIKIINLESVLNG